MRRAGVDLTWNLQPICGFSAPQRMFESWSHLRPLKSLCPVPSPQGWVPAIYLICRLLLAVLTVTPLAHSAGYRATPLLPARGSGKPGFTQLPAQQLGINFTNYLSDSRVRRFQNTMNGCGVAAGDFDGDGWCDLFFCNKDGPSALFRATGAGSFTNVTALTRTAVTNQISSGAAFADLNGDGRLDLFMSSFGGPNALLMQGADGQFTDTTVAAGLVGRTGSTSMAMSDLDGDGDLDLYLCNFGTLSILRDGGQISTRMENGKPVVTGRYAAKIKIVDGNIVEFGEPDAVYWNDGSGRFTAANWGESFLDEEGRPYSVQPDFGLAVQIRDTNGDGLPDIYVCNDFQTHDRFWINQGKGRFQLIPREALRNMSYASMGVDFADLDRDGHLDFITVEMLSLDHRWHLRQSSPTQPLSRIPGRHEIREEMPRNCLYQNRGDGTYAELGFFGRVAASDWSWTPVFLDVDFDGYEDLLVSNGNLFDVNSRDVSEANARMKAQQKNARANLGDYAPLKSPKRAFRNKGQMRFEEVGDAWGFNSTDIAHGMALIDFDHDGDMDVVMNAINAAPLVYRNDSTAPRVAVRLKGKAPNTQGIGARIRVLGGAVPVQEQEILAGGYYLSGSEPMRSFAVGSNPMDLTIEVRWRSGAKSVLTNAMPGQAYEIDETSASRSSTPSTPTPVAAPWFENATSSLGVSHSQTPHDDFAAQPLLPRKLSQMGPGICAWDFNRDGHDDLAIAGGAGQPIAIRLNDGRGGFVPIRGELAALPDDGTCIAAWTDADGTPGLIVGVANHRVRDDARGAAQTWKLGQGSPVPAAPLPPLPNGATPGCFAMGDVQGDGSLELFVGAAFKTTRYPEPVSSVLYRRAGNQWVFDEVLSGSLKTIERATGAVFSDLDNDGASELVVACDWGAVRVLRFQNGTLHDVTDQWGLGQDIGWWSGVVAGDWDADGRMDLLVGNWGLNGPEQVWSPLPRHAHFGDWVGDGTIQILETLFDSARKLEVPARDLTLLRAAIPSLQDRIQTHAQYSAMSAGEILAPWASISRKLSVTTLETRLWLNRGNRFVPGLLPPEAQHAPVYGIVVADADGDGWEDAFLAQNCFSVRPEATRLDAGLGLWLRGGPGGRFTAVKPVQSGVRLSGEQRGCASGDFDSDGRTDLVVAENGGPVHLFLNRAAREGVRVSLRGSDANPYGIGASIRLRFEHGWGPLREVLGPSGYASQSSPVQAMATPTRPLEIQVRWPGGKVVTKNVEAGVREITVRASD